MPEEQSPRGLRNLPSDARAELRRVRSSLARLDGLLADLDTASVVSTTLEGRRRPERYYAVLVDVYEYGRHGIDARAFADRARRHDYDARGLGGFFLGARAPLRRNEDRVTLTTEGHRLVAAYLSGQAL